MRPSAAFTAARCARAAAITFSRATSSWANWSSDMENAPLGSAAGQEPVENSHAELKSLDGDTLVNAVEQRGEVEIRRQPQRGEPEAADADLAPRLGVGTPGEH